MSSASEVHRDAETVKEAWFMRREATACFGLLGRGRMGRGRIEALGRMAG